MIDSEAFDSLRVTWVAQIRHYCCVEGCLCPLLVHCRSRVVYEAITILPEMWQVLDSSPRTMTHNDCSPRNICLRKTPITVAPSEGTLPSAAIQTTPPSHSSSATPFVVCIYILLGSRMGKIIILVMCTFIWELCTFITTICMFPWTPTVLWCHLPAQWDS